MSEKKFPWPAPLLGLDPGDSRVGVAVSDESGEWFHALETLRRAKGRDDFDRLAQLVKKFEVQGFVIGLPLLPSGDEGDQCKKARGFARGVANRWPTLYVALADERFSTFEAESERRDAGVDPHAGPGRDAFAARQILQNFFREGPFEVVQEGGK
jgi:putative Holliday junction resolvase